MGVSVRWDGKVLLLVVGALGGVLGHGVRLVVGVPVLSLLVSFSNNIIVHVHILVLNLRYEVDILPLIIISFILIPSISIFPILFPAHPQSTQCPSHFLYNPLLAYDSILTDFRYEIRKTGLEIHSVLGHLAFVVFKHLEHPLGVRRIAYTVNTKGGVDQLVLELDGFLDKSDLL